MKCCRCKLERHIGECNPVAPRSPAAFGLSRHTLGTGSNARWYWVRAGRRYTTIGELLAVEGSEGYRARWAA